MAFFFASLLTVATVAFLNGANDISRSIAVLVGAGVRDYKKACKIGTLGTVIGSAASFWFAIRMVETFTKTWTAQPLQPSPSLLLGILVTIAFWLTAMTSLGIPVSTTHTIVGAFIGLSLVKQGWEQVLWGSIGVKVFLPLLVSPFLASAVSWFLYRALITLDRVNPCLCIGEAATQLDMSTQGEVIALIPAKRLSFIIASAHSCRQFLRHQVGITADHLHLLSAIAIAVARALNDTPKIVALGLLAQGSVPQSLLFALAALAMGAGSLVGGWRVTRTLANKITTLDNRTGLSANLTTALLVAGCANLGLPVSTTQVAGGSIIGVGIAKGAKNVYWDMVRNVALAWLITLPVCAVLSAAISLTLTRF